MRGCWSGRAIRATIAATLALAFLFGFASRQALADVQYSYDDAGRLIQIVDGAGDSAQYVYDPAGNITQIVRVSAGTVAVAGFTPQSGPVGTSVTIYGSGFSATPSSNTVEFNGTAAAVSNASANQLVAVVPSGATTGTISVTVGAQSANSAESFTVTSGSGAAPTITGFTPGGGPPGTAVTINGTDFDPVLINNTVRFNGAAQQANIASATTTQIAASVPSYAGSGRISVRTPYGIGVSADDFLVPPNGYAYADFVALTRVAIDGASGSLSIGTTNKHGMVLFDGAPGDYLTLQLSAFARNPAGSVGYKIFDPTNAQIASGSVSSISMSIHLPRLPRAGTYSIVFSPGNATASLTFALTRNAVLLNAQGVGISIPVSGQSARAVYSASAGSSSSLRLGLSSVSPSNEYVRITVYNPDGTQAVTATGFQSTDGTITSVSNHPVSGTYTVHVSPADAATASTSVMLNPPVDIEVDGAQLNISNSSVRYALFAGTAGQRIGLALSALSYSPSSTGSTNITVLKPDGSTLTNFVNSCYTGNPGGSCGVNLPVLPVDGIYAVRMTPPSGIAFSGTLTLSNPLTGTLVSGTPFSANLARPGQLARLTLNGTEGQAATLRFGVASTTPANQTVTMSVYAPNGTLVAQTTGSEGTDGANFYIPSLPATGAYDVWLHPWFGLTASMTATLDPEMDLAIDGSAVGMSTSVASYAKRMLFSGTAGQQVSVALTALSYSPGTTGSGTLRVYRPDGSQLAAHSSCYTVNVNCSEIIVGLATTGTYTVTMTPPGGRTFSGTLRVASPITGTLASGTPFNLNLAQPGNYGRLTFSGTAAQPATLRFSLGALTPNATAVMSLYRQNGAQMLSTTGTQSSDGAIFHVPSLPATETYTVYVIPWYNSSGSATVTLNPDMDLEIGAAPSSISTTTAGHVKRFLVDVPANSRVGVGITNIVHTPASSSATAVAVLKPDGSTYTTTNCYTSGLARCEFSFNTVTGGPAGPYTIRVTPPASRNFSGTITLSDHVTGSLTVGGGAVAVSLDRDGQDGVYTFGCTSGQLLRLSVTGLSTNPSGQPVYIAVQRPDYSILASYTPSAANTTLDIPQLDTSGDCVIYMSPVAGAKAYMNMAIDPR